MLNNLTKVKSSVLLPYDDVLEIVDILEELDDKETLRLIAQGRYALRRSVKGISAPASFKRKTVWILALRKRNERTY